MADQLRIQEAITFIQQTPPETFRLMDVTINTLPTGYEHGKVTVEAATTDLEIATDVNIFVMSCETGIDIKLGSSVSPAIENVTHFSYKGDKTSVFATNSGTEDISVAYATGKI
ncbi:MAG: hypothetical protein PHD05_00615 [Sphaerochaetaceae bacterium]|jgi:hypothetical protein|nr:hypothetical protein [Sphaerochaetaceae bacterium]